MGLKFDYVDYRRDVRYDGVHADVMIKFYNPLESVDILVYIYANKQARDAGMDYIGSLTFQCSQRLPGGLPNPQFDTWFAEDIQKIANNSLLSLTHKYLLTLPEFEGATEV